MMINKTSKWAILSIGSIIYIALIVLLKILEIFSELTFIFFLSIAPIIIINVYFILEKGITAKFKIILPGFSSVFIIAYCYIFLFLIPSKFAVIEKFDDNEFGILLVNNIENELKAKVDLKRVRKRLEEIKMIPSDFNKSFRIEQIDELKKIYTELEFSEFIQKEIIDLNASVAIVIQKIIRDSVYSEIYGNKKLIDRGIRKTVFKIISSPIKLANILKENMESLLTITMADSAEIEIVVPKTNVEKIVISNRHYENSTKILERIFEIPNNSIERQEKVKQAEDELRKSVQIDSSNDRSLARLALLKNLEEGKHDSAAIYYEKAKRVQPQDYGYTWNLAQTYYLTGETAKAIRTLEDYLEQYGNLIEDVSQRLEMEKLLRSFQGIKEVR